MTSYIFFVHGWRWEGDYIKVKPCEQTFSQVSSSLKQQYPKCIFKYFDYCTGPFKFPPKEGNKDITKNAKALLNQIGGVIDDYLSEKSSDSESDELKIALIGHSAGGLVVRQALVIAQELASDQEILQYVKNAVLIASPSSGTPIFQKFGGLLGSVTSVLKGAVSPQVIQLNPTSDFIHDLNSKWSLWTKKYTFCNVNCIYAGNDEIAPPPSPRKYCIPNPPNQCLVDKKCTIISNVGHNTILECKNNSFTQELIEFLSKAGFKQ